MSKTTWTLLVLVSFVVGLAVAGVQSSSVSGQRTNPAGESVSAPGELIAISNPTQVGHQLTIVDPRLRVICVYQVDRSSGQLTLKSVRNVHWDMMMDEFNGMSPSPREIRAMLHR